jgi:integrase
MTKLINRHNKTVTPPAKPLPHVRLHDLRHLHATSLLAGVPVHVSQPASAMPIQP